MTTGSTDCFPSRSTYSTLQDVLIRFSQEVSFQQRKLHNQQQGCFFFFGTQGSQIDTCTTQEHEACVCHDVCIMLLRMSPAWSSVSSFISFPVLFWGGGFLLCSWIMVAFFCFLIIAHTVYVLSFSKLVTALSLFNLLESCSQQNKIW